jgi:serine phosphatase RsbU (regulator of sigma subunit)
MTQPNNTSARLKSRTSLRKAVPGSTSRALPAVRSESARSSDRHSAKGHKGPSRRRGAKLRGKFMFVLTCVTATAMIVLGLTMAGTTHRFLFGQKLQSGIEMARLAAQIGNSVLDAMHKELATAEPSKHAEIKQAAAQRLEKYLLDASQWMSGNDKYTDIIAVRFDGSDIHGFGIGNVEQGGAPLGQRYTQLYIPKEGSTITLPPEIEVFQGTRMMNNEAVPVYRFKIRLNSSTRDNVRVDIAAKSVVKVRNNLYAIIILAVVAGIGLVIFVANSLAGNITKPLDLLLKDMQVVARGNLNHQTKPRSNDEIGALAHEFNRMTGQLKVAQSALVEQEKAEYELSLARQVQRQLLPAQAPKIEGFDCAAFYQGAKAVSGDYFDIIPLDDGLWGFIVADVSGKGIPGSMVMAVTRTIVRLVADKHKARAAETLKETNRLIAKQIKRGMFVTAFYAILDERTSVLTYSSAGHNPMVVYRAANKTYELASAKGIAIGFNEGPIFDKTVQEARLVLNHGDAILIYTDGFPEAMNHVNEEFGEDRFYKSVARHGHLDSRALISNLVSEVAQHRGQAEQSDDLTIITVRKTS